MLRKTLDISTHGSQGDPRTVANAPPQQKAGPSAVDYFRLRLNDQEVPFCAIQITPNTNDSFGALPISVKAEALDAERNPVPGLYSAGTLANVEMFCLRYADSGASLCMGTVTDHVAGLAAPLTGAYAYTMPAAIPADYDDGLVEKRVELFVTENLEG